MTNEEGRTTYRIRISEDLYSVTTWMSIVFISVHEFREYCEVVVAVGSDDAMAKAMTEDSVGVTQFSQLRCETVFAK